MKKSVYTRGFPSSFTKENLSTLFNSFGKVIRVKFVSQEKNLYAIVKFFSEEHAQNAIINLHGKVIDGIKWYANFCEGYNCQEKRFRLDEDREKTIILKDLPECFTEKAARWIFDRYGLIKNVDLRVPDCFITFETIDAAEEAERKEKYLVFEGQRIYVAILKSKSVMRNLIQNRRQNRQRNKNINQTEDSPRSRQFQGWGNSDWD
jgi:RNA recognition motif-containing protein